MSNNVGQLAEPHTPTSATLTGMLAAAELANGDVLAGRFRIEAMLGVGGMGVVYRAHDTALGIDVAIKLLRPELARKPEAFDRFRQELLLARQVSSTHVVRIHDIAEHEGRWFITMDYIDGESLERRMDRGGKLDPDVAVPILGGLLEGLAAAHERGVVHRDLKPANILLDRDGKAYITDFGVARSLGATGGMTQSGVVFGTPEYLSPEQARGGDIDGRSDLYAVGLMLYEMLSGTLPFSGGTPAETVMRRIVRQPPSLSAVRPDLPSWLRAFCDRLLKLNPAHRFASAREALKALETRRVPRPPLNRTAILAAVLAVVVTAGAVDLGRREAWFARAPAAAAPVQTPRVAVLPFFAAGDDADVAAAGRGVEEHLRAWLRADSALAVESRTRTLAAIARAAPDLTADTLPRQAHEIAHAANATAIVGGRVGRDAQGFVLKLDLIGAAEPASGHTLEVRGKDADALFEAYRAAVPTWLRQSGVAKPAEPPTFDARALAPYGHALRALDAGKPADAAAPMQGLVGEGNALAARAELDAREALDDPLALANLRDAIAAKFSQDMRPAAREVYARALAGSDKAAAAANVLAAALERYPHDPGLAIARAELLAEDGDDQSAADALKRFVADDDGDAHAWFLLGKSSIKRGDAQPAVDDYLVRALVLNTRAGDTAAVAETENAMGVGYERLGQLEPASEQYARAAAVREKLGDKEGLAKSLRNLAIVEAERGEDAAADRALVRVKALLEELGDKASLADLYNDRGVVLEERGDFAGALRNYREALAMRQQLDLPEAVAESLNNVGYCAYHMGDFDNAGVYWQQALAQYQKIDDKNGTLHVTQSVALLDLARGRFAMARKRLEDSLRTAEEHQLPEEEAVANVSLAEVALVEGRYADAAAAAGRAAQIFARRSDRRGSAEAALLQARTALALGDAAGADAALARIDPTKLGVEQRAGYSFAQARSAVLAGDFTGANAKLDAAAAAAGEAHSGSLAMNIRLERVRMALAQGDIAAAKKTLAAVRQRTTELGEIPVRLAWLELELALAVRMHDTDAAARYREILLVLKTSGRYRDAVLIHRLGEHAVKAADAASAREAASQALQQLLDSAPAERRESLRQLVERCWQEESGDAHGA